MVYAPPRPGRGRGLSRAKHEKRNGCHYCDAVFPQTVDHIVPRSLGGPDAQWNLVPCCQACNSAKANRWPTCECPKCRLAVERFVSDPDLRDKALTQLRGRMNSYSDGIRALVLRRDETMSALLSIELHSLD
jgi:hypothetical protein